MGTNQRFVVSAKVPDISTPSPREVHALGIWLSRTKPSARKAVLTPVATAGPSSRGVTHQSTWVPAGRGLTTGSEKTLGSRLPRNKRCLLSGVQIGEPAAANSGRSSRDVPPAEGTT